MIDNERIKKMIDILSDDELMQDIVIYNDFKEETGFGDMPLSKYLKDLKEEVLEIGTDYDGNIDAKMQEIDEIDVTCVVKAMAAHAIRDEENVKKLVCIVCSDYYTRLIESSALLESATEEELEIIRDWDEMQDRED